jgi:hypothetical protein
LERIASVKPGNLSWVAGPLSDAARRKKLSHTLSERRGKYTFD